ncbi:hypothetical protein [Agromyces larvae]|uniref:Uncharacterized protein n=1 Tax=Agromyces larvae TaxID=2929802 RepID=A0ABY4BTV0_9MICO|nr:hypothetical protein [Agromyces larvae]UOE42638.1 hypothetical protein MTO99_10570 [Agromyces larvae]
MSDTLAERCARLQAPVTELIAVSLSAAYRPQDLPELSRAIRAVRGILAEDPSGLPDGPFTQWLPTALRNLDRMQEAVDRGDAAASYAVLTDKTDGFIRLTVGCAGFPGWSPDGEG